MALSSVSEAEEIFKLLCNGCQRDGANKMAEDYCKACRAFYCEECLSYHSRFSCLKLHNNKLVGREGFKDMTKPRMSPSPSMSTWFTCNVCASAAVDKEGIDYCQACKEFFCSVCLTSHTRWKQDHVDRMFGTEDMLTMINVSKLLWESTQRNTTSPELLEREDGIIDNGRSSGKRIYVRRDRIRHGIVAGHSPEELFHLTCNGCRQDGVKSEAVDYCKDCKEFFCEDCLKYHNRLTSLKSHLKALIGREKFVSIANPRHKLASASATGISCDQCQLEHTKQIAEVFCKACREFFCRGCVKYHNKMPSLDHHYNKMVWREDLADITKPKQSTVCAVGTKFSCSSCANGLDNTPSVEYCFSCTEFFCNVCLINHIRWTETHGDKMLGGADLMAMIRASKSTGDSPTRASMFVSTRKDNKSDQVYGRRQAEPTVTPTQPLPTSGVTDDHSEGAAVRSKLTTVQESALGSSELAAARSSTEEKIIKVKIREQLTENDVCEAVGSCSLPGGGWLLADSTNQVLKRFDENNLIIDRCKLPERPQGVCYILINDEAAVTMARKTVVIVSLTGGMICSRSIKLNFVPHGVTFALGLLYVAPYQGKEIYEYKLKGTLKRKIAPSVQKSSSATDMKKMTKIRELTASEDGSRLYVTDIKGLFILDIKRGTILHAVSLDIDPQSVSLGDDGSLFVCGWDSIIQLDRDGGHRRSVATPGRYEGCSPVSICYHRDTARLVVMVARELEGFDYIYLMNMK